MSDADIETVDIADAGGDIDDDEQIELDTVEDADNNGDHNEPYEIDTLDETETTEFKEKTPPPTNNSRKRSRSRSAEKKEEEKDDFEDNELDSEVEDTELTEDAEAEERELLSMPPLKSVMTDVGHLKTERRIIVHPLDFNELSHQAMIQTVSKGSCEEIKLNFVRPKDNIDSWSGIAVMHFTSSKAAKEAVEELKTIREDISVKSDEETAYPRTFVENWIKTEKGQKRWTETLLFVKNINENVTVEQLKEVFTDSEDIVFAKQESRRKEEKTKAAYVVYRTADAAVVAARQYADSVIELEGNVLKVYKYHVPAENPPRGLLRLHERRVVLKYFEKLSELVELATEEEKAPEWCTKRHKICLSVIEQDNKCRENLGLSTPLLDELRANRGVKVVQGSKRKDLLIRLGVIAPKRRSYGYSNRNSSDRKKSNYGSSSNQSLLGNPPSLLNLNMRAVPLSLMMQQSGMSYMGGMSDRRNAMSGESSNKMLRLDSSGNFHVDFNKDRQRRRDDRDDRSRSSKTSRYDRR